MGKDASEVVAYTTERLICGILKRTTPFYRFCGLEKGWFIIILLNTLLNRKPSWNYNNNNNNNNNNINPVRRDETAESQTKT